MLPAKYLFSGMVSGIVAIFISGTGLCGSDFELPEPDFFSGDSFPPAALAGAEPAFFPDLKKDSAGYWQVDFQHLASFSFGHHKADDENPLKASKRGKFSQFRPEESDAVEMPTEPGKSGPIPAAVRALDGKPVSISGYMLPIKMEEGLVREFLLLRNQSMCCYGRRPELNEWVVVKMKGKGVPSKMDTPLTFFGTLHVGEIFENNTFEGLYELDGEKVAGH